MMAPSWIPELMLACVAANRCRSQDSLADFPVVGPMGQILVLRYSFLKRLIEASRVVISSCILLASFFLMTAASSRALSSCLSGSTLLSISAYSSWAIAHFTMGPQTTLAR